ncbi:amino acid permease-domain-containing protein [Kalaharituber pfeilii]|nr:amino acid permease-domain-containing protein [Kalaharituber pfeilii]
MAPISYSPPTCGGAAGASRDSFELASLASSSSRSSLASSSSRSGISSSRRLSLSSEHGETSNLNAGDEDNDRPVGGRHYRSYSVSSAFDFNSHLIPLSTSASGGATPYAPLPSSITGGRRGGGATQAGSGSTLERRKTLTFTNSLSLLLSLQIGSGIFSSPSQVNNHAGSPGMALIVWALAGLLAWTGAASYAELGGAIPLNGGAQAYLRYTFGEGAAFVFAWTAVAVLKPGSAAIIAIIFGEYANRVVFGSRGEEAGEGVSEWGNKLAALSGLVVVTLMNGVSTRLTARMSDLFMVLKVGALVAITVIGIVVAATGWNGDGRGASTEWKERNWFAPVNAPVNVTRNDGRNGARAGHVGGLQLGEIALALYAGLWAFDGWDNVNYVTGEMRHPARDLPLVIHTAMPTVILCYLLANVSYYLVLPSSVISNSNTVAVAFGNKVFGPAGGIIFALTVTISCFGALNATTFTSGRLVYVAGKEGYLPRIFGQLGWPGSSPASPDPPSHSSSRTRAHALLARVCPDTLPWHTTPLLAILLNTFLTALYILVGSFSTLLTFYGVAGYTFYFLTVLGLIVLRATQPELERPYRTWIVTPICFCCVSLFLVTRGVFSAPVETVAVLCFVTAGWPLYYWRVGGGWEGWKNDVAKWGTRIAGWVKRPLRMGLGGGKGR